MRKFIVILFAIMLLMPVAPAIGQIVRTKQNTQQLTSPAKTQQPSKPSTPATTTRSNKSSTRGTAHGTRNRSGRTRSVNANRYHSTTPTKHVRENAPMYDISFGCNANGAVIIIDDEEYNVDDSCMLRGGTYTVEVEAEGYRDYTEVIEVDEENTYFYFELDEFGDEDEVPMAESQSSFGFRTSPPEPVEEEPEPEPQVVIQDLPNETFTAKGVSFTMVYVQGGTYVRYRLPDVDDLHPGSVPPAHRVTLSSYYIGMHEVTRQLWYAVMADSVVNNHPLEPMSNVSWEDCHVFLKKLNSLTGRTFRLPTDAEWEFAARGGVKGQGYAFSGSNNIDEIAWYNGNSENEYHDVGLKKPNELGVYDMTGGVWEWCSDFSWNWRQDISERSPALVDPTGPENSGRNTRVARGGGLLSEREICCVCRPDPTEASIRSDELGFRVVLVK